MKQPLYYASALIVVASLASAFSYKKSRAISESVTYAETTVSRYDLVMRDANSSSERIKNVDGAGAVTYSYQLALAESKQQPARIEKLVAESGLVLVDRKFDRPFSITVSGTNVNVVKFISKIESDIQELKITSSRWTAQNDGTVSVQLGMDVWQIPQPNVPSTKLSRS